MREFKDYRIAEDHNDLLFLANELTNNGFRFDRGWKNEKLPCLRESSSAFKDGDKTIRVEANYIRVSNLRYWTDEDILKIKKVLENTSKKTNTYSFELGSVCDFEEDPGERTWDASFTLHSHKK